MQALGGRHCFTISFAGLPCEARTSTLETRSPRIIVTIGGGGGGGGATWITGTGAGIGAGGFTTGAFGRTGLGAGAFAEPSEAQLARPILATCVSFCASIGLRSSNWMRPSLAAKVTRAASWVLHSRVTTLTFSGFALRIGLNLLAGGQNLDTFQDRLRK